MLKKIYFNHIKDCYKWLDYPRHKGYTVIFHNGGGYDYNFITRSALDNGILPKIL